MCEQIILLVEWNLCIIQYLIKISLQMLFKNKAIFNLSASSHKNFWLQ
jgi:hypothetical protein